MEPVRQQSEETIDWRFKGFPYSDPTTIGELCDRRLSVLAGDVPTPAAVLIDSRLTANLETMAEYCRHHGVSLAPHGKTTMSPQLIQRQLDIGAWGVTVASIAQARVLRAFGCARILLANEIVDTPSLNWVARELSRDDGFEFFCYVDSIEGVKIMSDVLSDCTLSRRVPVLVEVGEIGGRAGCRSVQDARRVADAVADTAHLRLVGVAGFEGILVRDRSPKSLQRVDGFLERLRVVAGLLGESGSFENGTEVVVTAGGSAFFDRVIAILGRDWPEAWQVRLVLRSGCYLTHDAGMYNNLTPFGTSIERDELRPALEIWGRILSRPEPNLAIADFGRRDVSFDAGLPVPHAIVSRGSLTVTDARDRLRVRELNDQHAYVEVEIGTTLDVGDLIGCGISHPCTTFDKWRMIPVVDDDYVVIGAVHTYF